MSAVLGLRPVATRQISASNSLPSSSVTFTPSPVSSTLLKKTHRLDLMPALRKLRVRCLLMAGASFATRESRPSMTVTSPPNEFQREPNPEPSTPPHNPLADFGV